MALTGAIEKITRVALHLPIKSWFNLFRVDFLEVYQSPEEVVKYFEVGDFPFNFGLINEVHGPEVSAQDVDSAIHTWYDIIPEGKTSNWVVNTWDGF